MSYVNFEELVGKTLTQCNGAEGGDVIEFVTTDGERYQLYHTQDCCEHVYIEDICGNLEDLVGSPIIRAYESTKRGPPLESYSESHTWTFYNLSTVKGSVTIRWYGTSNGYYSESVDFRKIIVSR